MLGLKLQNYLVIKQAKYFKILIFSLCILIVSSFVLPALFGSMGGDSRGGNISVTL